MWHVQLVTLNELAESSQIKKKDKFFSLKIAANILHSSLRIEALILLIYIFFLVGNINASPNTAVLTHRKLDTASKYTLTHPQSHCVQHFNETSWGLLWQVCSERLSGNGQFLKYRWKTTENYRQRCLTWVTVMVLHFKITNNNQ